MFFPVKSMPFHSGCFQIVDVVLQLMLMHVCAVSNIANGSFVILNKLQSIGEDLNSHCTF